jgi:hypothetical protein
MKTMKDSRDTTSGNTTVRGLVPELLWGPKSTDAQVPLAFAQNEGNPPTYFKPFLPTPTLRKYCVNSYTRQDMMTRKYVYMVTAGVISGFVCFSLFFSDRVLQFRLAWSL